MDDFTAILNLIKEIFSMMEALSTWRFLAILVTIVLCFLVWKLPSIIQAIRWW
ncbi:hypothetical protein [Haemophilus parahaemolyticus]|uniref:hypothetical protein n=1 Tax=Haemophilus parahaemolyticus TaxID=735 RepID=UPI0028E8D33E|nr:hypothetical protein [Haemophilus parahaemolyticus]